MCLSKLLKSKNTNKNEASVAALKFVDEVSKEGLQVFLFNQTNKPLSRQQIQELVNQAYSQGSQEGYNRGYRDGLTQGKEEAKQLQPHRRPIQRSTSTTNISTTSGNRIIFNQ